MKTGQASGHQLLQLNNISWGLPYTVFLYIWGTQWVLSSCIGFWGQWQDVELWQKLTVWLALAASLYALVASLRSGKWRQLADQGGKAALPLLMIIGAVSVLQYVQAVDPFFAPLLRSFVLAIAYAQLAIWLGKPLIYMSLWLFLLTSVVAVWYLGFASMLLGGFGGLSMIAVAWIIRSWNRNSRTREVSK
ncbi:hypothetical protein [Paenibacillus radicis (ex Xue et al. 2023)]|uniref:Uncharacterized protein n=1 Tax=Paenibacillus radicis (ex Xue et al. 2023) TaxID=2972489 RepID=A0ABT1YT64_9BACL|nr:hypothetical protein [Paenibacillus radicis (ex Xue et al. 2023)]MCR8636363.1 hypothetical protein [Paenibacillus radicis (ex Xue et al. 2023)]